ncbi:Six-hairpin glycosidase [Mycena sanguinolenta]|uniref:Six-hairpin glycosidase n=1 Tax=Mycena sanguinolenta TaxID=230812 RepID=A0A8H6ZAF7_9AGAR|nr:Six-hairpin glycosidase [Mycena sanguinolenta]
MRSLSVSAFLWLSLLAPTALGLAPAGPWDAFNFAPKSKTVYPASIREQEGTVTNSQRLVNNAGSATLNGQGTYVTLDFGVEVGGLISMNLDSVVPTSSLALSFTESPMFIRPTASDDSSFPSANTTYDTVLPVPAPLTTGLWTQPAFSLRGGFRFLTIVLTSAEGAVTLSNVSCAISFMPHVDDLRAYTGYFFAEDPGFHDENFLTKIWMAGAYTVQTNTVAVNTGRQVPFEPAGHWANNATLGIAGPIIVDGAKRDRAVWPGDMGIAVPTQFVSTNDLIPTRNALGTMLGNINPITGALPESGPPLSQLGSDTYHCWTLIGTHNYYLYSGDLAWVQNIWSNYTKAVAFLEAKVDPKVGLMNVTGLRDWARLGQGGFNAEANAILYHVLTTAASLATAMSLPDLAAAWTQNATALKTNYNAAYWVPELGMYRDNMTTTLTPQDANSLAVLFNVTNSTEQAVSISAGLEKNWGEFGPVAPELPGTITPFISGFELQAHFVAGNASRAMDLLHREWGYILYTNLSVQSTLIEGFTANGSIWYRSFDGYNFDPAYTSHAHGWSSGPTSALTIYVLGLSVTGVQGSEWLFSPNIAGLPHAEGGFETPLGWFGASWTASTQGSTTTFNANVDVPTGTSGVFVVPRELQGSGRLSVSVDGRKTAMADDGSVSLAGGTHTVLVAQD